MLWLRDLLPVILTVGLGVSFIWNKAEKVLKVMKELADVLTVVSTALADKKLTPEEIDSIKKEAGEAIAAFKAVLK